MVEAGLLIHEGQLFFLNSDCTKWSISVSGGRSLRIFLAAWRHAVRRARPRYGPPDLQTIRDSVSYGLEHREEALITRCSCARDGYGLADNL